MALTVGDRDVRPLTVDDVRRMVEAGILADDEPAELLHGVLVARAVKSPAHEAIKTRLIRWLVLSGPAGGHEARVEAPIDVPDRTSLPEPDLAAVAAHGDPSEHPSTALLVIEVAASSLTTDTRIKPPLFAAAGVPEMWVVDVAARTVRVFTEPHATGYSTETVLDATATLAPTHVAAPPLALRELFAGL